MKFLGIDLGWRSQPSGLCCLEGETQLRVVALDRLLPFAEILSWVDAVTAYGDAVVAVDAPTLIANPSGMRLADRLTHKYFGRYHAGSYPANLSSPFAERTIGFGLSLEAKGFCHAPVLQPKQPGRYQIEVFPHPAIVHLFGLERILKYKKGKLSDRRAALTQLRDYILTLLPTLEPALDAATVAPLVTTIPSTGAALKALEDQLDSLICAYVAAHWWYWGTERNWVLGAATPDVCRIEGYIVVPAPSRAEYSDSQQQLGQG